MSKQRGLWVVILLIFVLAMTTWHVWKTESKLDSVWENWSPAGKSANFKILKRQKLLIKKGAKTTLLIAATSNLHGTLTSTRLLSRPRTRGLLHLVQKVRQLRANNPELVNSRDRDIVIVCRSGHRSLLAGRTLKEMGFSNVRSLKTGLRGWNDHEMPMVRQDGEDPVIEANADKFFTPQVREDQFKPKET